MTSDYAPDFIKRVEKAFSSSQMSLRELSDKSSDLFGVDIPYETIKMWSRDYLWDEKRRHHRTFCPHCNGDITEIVSGGRSLDVAYMYTTLITRLFDEIVSEEKTNPRKVAEWKNLMKEAGLKTTDQISTGRSDLDSVLDAAREKGIL